MYPTTKSINKYPEDIWNTSDDPFFYYINLAIAINEHKKNSKCSSFGAAVAK